MYTIHFNETALCMHVYSGLLSKKKQKKQENCVYFNLIEYDCASAAVRWCMLAVCRSKA